jgi:succinate dehydrogenase / fumarate reductase membrane anchor subunit
MNMQSDFARVRGLGSAKEGTAHWWVQRLTAIVLVPLGLWVAYAAVALAGADLATFKAWLAAPGNLLLMVLFVGAMFHHMQLGLQVVVEDYVQGEKAKVTTLIFIKLGTIFLGVSSLLAIFRVVVGGQA